MEIAAIVERLDGIHRELSLRMDSFVEILKKIEDQRLQNIEIHLRTLNGRVGTGETWRAGADQMIDSINERIAENTDGLASFKKSAEEKLEVHQSFMDQQKGWNSGRTQMIVQVSMLLGIAATLLTMLLRVKP